MICSGEPTVDSPPRFHRRVWYRIMFQGTHNWFTAETQQLGLIRLCSGEPTVGSRLKFLFWSKTVSRETHRLFTLETPQMSSIHVVFSGAHNWFPLETPRIGFGLRLSSGDHTVGSCPKCYSWVCYTIMFWGPTVGSRARTRRYVYRDCVRRPYRRVWLINFRETHIGIAPDEPTGGSMSKILQSDPFQKILQFSCPTK